MTAQGGTGGWATTTEQTDEGTIEERRGNPRNRVLLWDVAGTQAGDTAVATLIVAPLVAHRHDLEPGEASASQPALGQRTNPAPARSQEHHATASATRRSRTV